MKILGISDLHLSANDPFNLNELKLGVLFEVLGEWINKVDNIFHFGDGQDSPKVSYKTITDECNVWKILGKRISDVVYLAGNHELEKNQYCPLLPFALGTETSNGKGMQIIGQQPKQFDGIIARGYSEEPIPDIPAKLFVGHHFVSYKNEKFFENKTQVSELQGLAYEAIVLGDVHQSYHIGKVWSVGTFSPSSFADVDIQAGYIVIEINDTVEITRYKNEDYPTFKKFVLSPDSEYPGEQEVKGNVVRVELSGPHSWNTYDLRKQVECYLRSMEPYYLDVRQIDTQSEKVQVAVAADLKTTDEALHEFMQERGWSKGMRDAWEKTKN